MNLGQLLFAMQCVCLIYSVCLIYGVYALWRARVRLLRAETKLKAKLLAEEARPDVSNSSPTTVSMNFLMPPGGQIDIGPYTCGCPWCGARILRHTRITVNGAESSDITLH